MKQLACEMCGGTDVLKMDGMFVCQNCGTKYSVEEAKKMMIEGTVEVQGTVKVDNTDVVKKFLQNARRAKANQDWEETEKYYNIVESNQPENWEAVFYSAYAKVMKYQSILHIIPVITVLINSMDQIIFHVEKLPNDEEAGFLIQLSEELHDMSTKVSADTVTSAHSNQVMLSHMLKVRRELAKVHYAFANELDTKIERYEASQNLIVENYKYGNLLTVQPFYPNDQYLKVRGDFAAYIAAKLENSQLCNKYVEKIIELDSSYKAPAEPSAPSYCYVATAVYGSYDCPQVWILRRYRDYTLSQTSYGRAFIYAYYAISPTVVKWFGQTEWFRKMWKDKLDRMVANLKAKGVEDTPYIDRNW